jgi:hypothetical protein
MNTDKRADLFESVAKRVVIEDIVKKRPNSATACLRLISPVPMLQLPGIYSLLN